MGVTRFLGALVGLLCLATRPARAEDAPSADALLASSRVLRDEQAKVVSALLARPDGRSRAWGAYLAAEHRIEEASPRLAELLGTMGGGKDRTEAPALLAVLDALVRLRADVGAKTLLPIVESRSTLYAPAAIALVIRGPEQAACLDAFRAFDAEDRSDEASWLALGNTLAGRGTAGFVRELLSRLTLRLEVSVVASSVGGGSGGSMSGFGDGRLDVPEGYPPLFLYSLTLRPAEGDVLLAPGRRPVHLHRRQLRVGFGSSTRLTQERDLERLGWIADAAGTRSEDLPVKASSPVVIEWTDAAAFLAGVAAARDAIARGHADLVRKLVAAGLLGAGEAAGLRPRIEVEVEDEREDKSVPLPPIPEAGTTGAK
jgi:hypothetical protein